ncbi:hypothetical protein Q31b_28970 [Novipirellula aureliae]|uniref:Uncharacterized protein n=1 Tax=Novipirellula aureliae TaxID=2527966 RepID=A0A5C6DXN5_9BACT|nr:hypothetical protein [Novipirellula aureliae]TWU41450.1 hypothetical protein Q31b_28970 [Novipirellula aureliae]
MLSLNVAETFRPYRAPKNDGESFADPSIDEAGGLLRENLTRLSLDSAEWQSLRHEARQQLISDAVRYTSTYRRVELTVNRETAPIVMAGHQPSLFHPGVWFKNFALDHIAKANDAIAINLVIDNDAASGSSIRVPTIDEISGDYTLKNIRYDRFGGGVPHEQTTISDRARFDRFDDVVSKAVAPIVDKPIIGPLWKHAKASVERCGVAGCALAQARHALEGDIGLSTLELPLGVACRGRVFAVFLLKILCDVDRFQDIYNSQTDLYREAHGIRSHAHPVPNLAREDGWIEAPIWIYSDEQPQRKAGWIKCEDGELVISNRSGLSHRFKFGPDHPCTSDEVALALADANTNSFKIRPRALLTTMYARMILSDLFLHGIGGGKYDQLGDRIAEQFFAIRPPQFMVVSATIQLPGESPEGLDPAIRVLRRKLRDIDYQPERFADKAELDEGLIEEKRRLIRDIPAKGHRREWQRRMEAINAALSSQLESVRSELRYQLALLLRRRSSLAILKSREHPFCVFNLDRLVDSYRKMLDKKGGNEVGFP